MNTGASKGAEWRVEDIGCRASVQRPGIDAAFRDYRCEVEAADALMRAVNLAIITASIPDDPIVALDRLRHQLVAARDRHESATGRRS